MTSRGEHLPIAQRIGVFSAATLGGIGLFGLAGFAIDETISFGEGAWIPETDEMASYDEGVTGLFNEGLTVSFAEDILDASNKQLTASELRLEEAQQSVPDACAVLLDNYLDGGVLESTHIDGIVFDMLNTDGQPCGEQPTEIRMVVSPLAEADDAIDDAEAFNDEAIRYVEYRRQKHTEDDDFDLKSFGFGFGLVVGLLCAIPAERAAASRLYKYQLKKAHQRLTRP